ncbi:MAG: DUF58 domain-containing protein [Dehalococcoidia bacterium]
MVGGAWLALTLALLIAAGVTREAPLYLATILLFLTGGVARLWARHLFSGVEYAHSISATRAFSGDTITLEVQISNLKILPLPWLRVSVEVPAELSLAAGAMSTGSSPNRRLLLFGLSLGPYHRITRRYSLRCDRRGFYTFGPAKIEAGDLFGFFRREVQFAQPQYLTVYPKMVPLEELDIPSKELFGDIRVQQHLFEDPVRVASTREYVAGDPLKRIHWASSARTGRLQTKVFDPTTSVDAALFFDTRTVPRPLWGYVEELLELGVLTAAAIVSHAHQRDIKVGLYVNQNSRRTDRMIQIPPSNHPDQLIHVLEALAQIHQHEQFSISHLVQRHARSLPWSTTLVVISAVPEPELLNALVRYKRAGRRVALVVPGASGRTAAPAAIPTYYVSDATPREEVEAISIEEGSA